MDGQSVGRGELASKPGGISVRPVSMAKWPSECPLYGWVNDRTSANKWLRWASKGKCSLINIPGEWVTMGLHSPRIESGASGFRSKLSCCDRPPERKT